MDTLRALSQTLLTRLFTKHLGRAHNQRGASALEYLVLAGVIVLVIGAAAFLVFGSGDSGFLNDAFQGLADCVDDGAACSDDG